MTSNEPNIGPTPSSFLDQSEEAASGGRRSLHFRRPKSAELRSGGQKGGGEERKNGKKTGKKREMKGRERGKDPTRVPPAAASPGRGVLRRRRASPSGLGLHPERCRSQPDFAGPHRETGMRGGDLGVKNSEIRRFKAVFFSRRWRRRRSGTAVQRGLLSAFHLSFSPHISRFFFLHLFLRLSFYSVIFSLFCSDIFRFFPHILLLSVFPARCLHAVPLLPQRFLFPPISPHSLFSPQF